MRNFLRMAHQHHIASCTPGSKLRGGCPNDMYARGIEKLSEFARENKLGRFHWPKACGSHAQEGAGGECSSEEDQDSSSNGSAFAP